MFVETIDVMQPYYCNSLFNKPFLQVRQKIHPILKNRKIHCRIIALHEYTSPQNGYTTFKTEMDYCENLSSLRGCCLSLFLIIAIMVDVC